MINSYANLKWLKSSTRHSDLPVTVLNDSVKFFSEYIAKFFDECLNNAKLPNCSKLTTFNQVFKKMCLHERMTNYQWVYCQLSEKCSRALYIVNFGSPLMVVVAMGFSPHHCLLTILKLWKEGIYKNKALVALITDLSS